MSLMMSSPHTPTGGQKTAQARRTPSSAKLEIGRDSFYFSVDLPPSKATPKKGTTPKKQSPARAACSTPTSTAKPDSTTRIPTKQTPSPRKNRNSIHQSPNKVFSSTPTKKGTIDASNDGRPCSPVKRAIELNSPCKPVNLDLGFAGKLVPRPEFAPQTHLSCVADVVQEDDYDADAIPSTHPIPNPREFLPPVRKRQSTVKPQSEDIGQLIAKLTADNAASTTDEWASPITGQVKTLPTPLHKASGKLQLKDPLSYRRLSSNSATSAPNLAVRIESESTVIFSESREIQQGGYEDDDTASQTDFESFLDLYTVQKPGSLQQAPMHESEAASKRYGETRVDSGKQVECRDPNDASLDLKGATEAGPSPNSKLQADTQNVQKIKRGSLKGVSPAFSRPANLTPPSSASNSHSMTGPRKSRSSCGIGSLRRPKAIHYDPESLPRVMTGSPSRPTLSKMPRAPVMPRRLPGKSTPALIQENSRDIAEQLGVGVAILSKTKGPGTSHSATTASPVKLARLSASSTPNKTTSTPTKQTSPTTKRNCVGPKSQIPSPKFTNAKAPVVSAPKHLSFKPSSKPIRPPSQQESNPKFPFPILKSTPSSRKLPIRLPRPETFDASAPRHQPGLPRPTITLPKRSSLVPVMKGWTKTPIRPATVVLESKTPKGSPRNPVTTTPPITLAPSPSPPQNPSPVPRPLLVSPQPTHSHRAPRYLSPSPSSPVVKRSRASPSPSPSPSMEFSADEADPNALRAPSNTIVNSLDRAIDAKIAADARRGLLLLEARVRAEAEAREDGHGMFL